MLLRGAFARRLLRAHVVSCPSARRIPVRRLGSSGGAGAELLEAADAPSALDALAAIALTAPPPSSDDVRPGKLLEPERPAAPPPPPPPKPVESKSLWQMVKRALKLLGREAVWIAAAAGLAIAAAALGVKTPSLLSELWESYSKGADVVWPLLKLGAVVAAQFILKYASSLMMTSNVETAAARLREQLFEAIINDEVAFFDAVHSAELVNLISVDVKELRDTLRSLLTEGLSYAATAAGGVAALVATSGKLSAALSAVVPFGMLAANVYGSRLRKLSRASQEAQARTAAVAAEGLSSIRTVKAFTAEDAERGRYRAALDASSAASMRISSEIGLFHGLLGLGLSGLAGAVFLYGGSLVGEGEMERAALLSFIMQTQGLTRSLEGLSMTHTRLLQAKGSFDRVNAVLDAAQERRARTAAQHTARWDGFKGALSLSGVSFAYPTRPHTLVLRDVSVDIPPGKVIALAGPSGSGKSTVAALLLGFYQLPEHQDIPLEEAAAALGVPLVASTDPAASSGPAALGAGQAAPSSPAAKRPASPAAAGPKPAHAGALAASARGTGLATADAAAKAFVAPPQASPLSRGLVTVDGRPLPYVDMKWYREKIAYVGQEAAIFSGTVRENIMYGKPAASEAEVIEACRAANAWAFVERLPQGLDTPVGERATALSGGQRQRIALARALIRDPAIIVLDEYSSALDAEAEAVVQETLAQRFKGRTVVVIAHRLSTIARADTIYVMAQGEVVESGSHEELCRRPQGVYASLVSRQRQLTTPGIS